MSRDKNFNIFIGKQRGGKSFCLESICNNMFKQGFTSLVYNRGKKNKDFKDYEDLHFLSIQETIEKIYNTEGKTAAAKFKRFPKLKYFYFREQFFDIHRLNFITRKSKIASFKMMYDTDERLLFNALFYYAENIHFVIDDARIITRDKVPKELFNLISRRDHTGEKSSLKNKNYGIDISLVYHDFDHVNPDIWSYNPKLIMYPTLRRPTGAKFSSAEAYDLVLNTWDRLNKEKIKKGYNYDAYIIDLEYLTVNKILGSTVKKIKNS